MDTPQLPEGSGSNERATFGAEEIMTAGYVLLRGNSSLLDAEAEALAARARGVHDLLTAVSESSDQSPYVLLVAQAINSQHSDGSWGSDDYPRTKPCFTAQSIIMLSHIDESQASRKTSTGSNLGASQRVQAAIRWLQQAQRDDGTWGEDAWDTCQVLKAFAAAGRSQTDPNVRAGLDYVKRCIDEDWPDRSSYWFGPGFLGCAMEALNRFDELTYSAKALEQVWPFFDEESGCFHLPSQHLDIQHAPPEWHTACVVSGLRSFGTVAPRRDRTLRAVEWLLSMQTRSGCWSSGHTEIVSYCTLQAIMALNGLGSDGCMRAARRGAEWFQKRCGNDGALVDRLMGAAAAARTYAPDLIVGLNLSLISELRDIIQIYCIQCSSLATETQILKTELAVKNAQAVSLVNSEKTLSSGLEFAEGRTAQLKKDLEIALERERDLQARLSSYAVRLTVNQLAVWGLVATVLSALVGILVPLLIGG